MTEFFVPGQTAQRSEEVYAFVVRYVEAMLDCHIDPVRIAAVSYRHEGKRVRAAVGETEPRTGQLVVAILRSDAYLICTPYYGVQRGEPIRLELADAIEVEYFEGLGGAREQLTAAVDALSASAGSMQTRIAAAAAALAGVTMGDFPPLMAADFLSLQHKLCWRGNSADTIAAMSDGEAENVAAAIRELHRSVLNATTP